MKRRTSYPAGRTILDEPERLDIVHYVLKHWLKQNQKWKSYGYHQRCRRQDCVVHA